MDKKLNICVFALALLLLVSLVGCGEASEKGEFAVTPEQESAVSVSTLPESSASSEESVAEEEGRRQSE